MTCHTPDQKGIPLTRIWLHNVSIVATRGGKLKCYCICGKQSSKLDTIENARAWISEHTQIKERPPKKGQK